MPIPLFTTSGARAIWEREPYLPPVEPWEAKGYELGLRMAKEQPSPLTAAIQGIQQGREQDEASQLNQARIAQAQVQTQAFGIQAQAAQLELEKQRATQELDLQLSVLKQQNEITKLNEATQITQLKNQIISDLKDPNLRKQILDKPENLKVFSIDNSFRDLVLGELENSGDINEEQAYNLHSNEKITALANLARQSKTQADLGWEKAQKDSLGDAETDIMIANSFGKDPNGRAKFFEKAKVVAANSLEVDQQTGRLTGKRGSYTDTNSLGGQNLYDVFIDDRKVNSRPVSRTTASTIERMQAYGSLTGNLNVNNEIASSGFAPPPAPTKEVGIVKDFISRLAKDVYNLPTDVGGLPADFGRGVERLTTQPLPETVDQLLGIKQSTTGTATRPATVQEEARRSMVKRATTLESQMELLKRGYATPEELPLAAAAIATGKVSSPLKGESAPKAVEQKKTTDKIAALNPFTATPALAEPAPAIVAGVEEEVIKKVNKEPLLADKHPLLKAMAAVESGGERKAKSKTGVKGLLQVTERTAKSLGKNRNIPKENIEAGEIYIANLIKQFGDTTLALAAYNGGPEKVEKAIDAVGGSHDWTDVKIGLQYLVRTEVLSPAKYKEMIKYPEKVLAYLYRFRNAAATAGTTTG